MSDMRVRSSWMLPELHQCAGNAGWEPGLDAKTQTLYCGRPERTIYAGAKRILNWMTTWDAHAATTADYPGAATGFRLLMPT
jgi:hypothetical protein